MTKVLAEDKEYTMYPRDQIFGDNNTGCCVRMQGLMNWRPQRRRRQRKINPSFWQWQRRRQLRKQKIQRVQVNVSNGGGACVFTGSGYWQQRWRRNSKTVPRTHRQQRRRQQMTRNIRRVQRAGDNNGGGETCQRARGIYDDNGGVGEGIWAQRLQKRQRKRWWRIDKASKVLEMTKEDVADWRQAQWIDNDNGVLVFLAIGLLTVTLSRLCLFTISFWYCFHQIDFFGSL